MSMAKTFMADYLISGALKETMLSMSIIASLVWGQNPHPHPHLATCQIREETTGFHSPSLTVLQK